MNFSKISNVNTVKLSRSPEQPIRTGQILRGQVLKLYPDNKAEINLGGNRLIANLEVGLELGGKYHFQVASTANVLELKVLGEQLKRNETVDLSRLLNQLGLKDNKHQIDLLRSLIRNSIPFDKGELQLAAQFLKGEKNKGLATNILVEMMTKKLPMTHETFQSIRTMRETTISAQLKSVIQQPSTLNQTQQNTGGNQLRNLEQQLVNSITMLTDKPFTFREGLIREITTQNAVNNQSLFQALRSLGSIPLDTNFSTWKNEWNQFTASNSSTTAKGNTLPFQLNENQLSQTIGRIEANRNEFIQAVQELNSRWNPSIQIQEASAQALSRVGSNSLRSEIKATITPYLASSQLQMLDAIPNTNENIMALYRGVQALGNNDNLSQLVILSKQAANHESFLSLSPKERFLEQVSQSFTLLGMDYENRLATEKNPEQVAQTIKGLLLQIGTNQDTTPEQQTKLLQHIQGMQLQSINETPTMIQANLQIPGERLGLVKDLELEFEGKKNADGEINPDYCRILFYLDLNKLGETVIDVNIQNRALSLTIFNNTDGLAIISRGIKDKLSNNLEGLDYRLSSVAFKKLEEKDQVAERKEESRVDNQNQGVDFRI